MKHSLKNIHVLQPKSGENQIKQMEAAVSYLEARAFTYDYKLTLFGLRLTGLLLSIDGKSIDNVSKDKLLESVSCLHNEIKTITGDGDATSG